MKTTRGTETSKYPKEKREDTASTLRIVKFAIFSVKVSIPQVVANERGVA